MNWRLVRDAAAVLAIAAACMAPIIQNDPPDPETPVPIATEKPLPKKARLPWVIAWPGGVFVVWR